LCETVLAHLKKWIIRFFRATPSHRSASSSSPLLFSFRHFWTSSKCGKSQGPFVKNRRRFFVLLRRFFGVHPLHYKYLFIIIHIYTNLNDIVRNRSRSPQKMDNTFFSRDSIAPLRIVFFSPSFFVSSFLDLFQMR